jgi:hypothetical protein
LESREGRAAERSGKRTDIGIPAPALAKRKCAARSVSIDRGSCTSRSRRSFTP